MALSNAADYSGGGTWFEALESVVHLDKGEAIVFDAKLFHAGVPITRGRRYLLVAFVYTADERQAACPGDLPACC